MINLHQGRNKRWHVQDVCCMCTLHQQLHSYWSLSHTCTLKASVLADATLLVFYSRRSTGIFEGNWKGLWRCAGLNDVRRVQILGWSRWRWAALLCAVSRSLTPACWRHPGPSITSVPPRSHLDNNASLMSVSVYPNKSILTVQNSRDCLNLFPITLYFCSKVIYYLVSIFIIKYFFTELEVITPKV